MTLTKKEYLTVINIHRALFFRVLLIYLSGSDIIYLIMEICTTFLK